MRFEYGGIVGLLVLAADIWAILNVFQSGASNGAKVGWTLVILVLPVVGLCAVVHTWAAAARVLDALTGRRAPELRLNSPAVCAARGTFPIPRDCRNSAAFSPARMRSVPPVAIRLMRWMALLAQPCEVPC